MGLVWLGVFAGDVLGSIVGDMGIYLRVELATLAAGALIFVVVFRSAGSGKRSSRRRNF